MSSEELVLLGIAITASAGCLGLFFRRTAMAGQWVTTGLSVLGTSLGLLGVGTFWAVGSDQWPAVPGYWPLDAGHCFSVTLDGLSAFFLVPIFLISLLGNIYGLAYWKQTEHPENGRKLRLFYGTMTAGMALLVIARNSICFLVGWEIMSLSAFFLITTEDHINEVRETGLVFLIATHVATLCLFALFALLRQVSGTFDFVPLSQDSLAAIPGIKTAIFVLALVGFGIKAGMMPFHVWLPSAHANAPSHVSAILSGVLLKTGIFGLMRVTSLLPDPPWQWGATMLTLGAVSGVLGVAFAIGQHDLKRLLAYHSIENIGIILMGLGLALLGSSLGSPGVNLIILGLAGALLHVWNHALFKALLFLSAGSVIHAAHTRDIDHLGGLAKTMPRTALCFLVGAAAICGLPPLNGFVSELLIYLGLFRTVLDRHGPAFAGAGLAAAALALIGALAVACFVKVFGAVFLGTPRSAHAEHVHESEQTMIGPMGVLIVCCFLIGLAPALIAPILAKGVSAWAPNLKGAAFGGLTLSDRLGELAPLNWITIMGLLLIAIVLIAGLALWLRLRNSVVEKGATWGCGYVAPTPRMQYTSSSFAQMLVGLFAWVLRPRTQKSGQWPVATVCLFPEPADFHSDVQDPVLQEAVLPAFRFGGWLCSWFRVFQQGSIQAYLLYMFIALIVLLLWR